MLSKELAGTVSFIGDHKIHPTNKTIPTNGAQPSHSTNDHKFLSNPLICHNFFFSLTFLILLGLFYKFFKIIFVL